MLNTSLRRVARHCPNSPLPSRPSTPTPITASFSSQTHQRRHSSSKRSIPPSSSHSSIPATQVKTVGSKNKSETQAKGIPETPAVTETEASGTIDVTKKRPGAESRVSHRREARSKKDYSNEWLVNVPSVAPTNHLKREDVHAASFYSIHRPIAINATSGLPNETSLDAFNALFDPKPKTPKKARANEVIYTLSSAVHNLDEHIAQQQRQGPPRGATPPQNRSDIISALTRHNDHAPRNTNTKHLDSPQQQQFQQSKNGTQVSISIQEIAHRFRPFNTPPVPVPMTEQEINASEHIEAENAKAAHEEMQACELEEQVRLQDDELTQHARTPRGRRVLHDFFTPRIVQIDPPRREISMQEPSPGGRTRIRRSPLKRAGIREDRKYHMISVRRQRKLKMKKHKYKKLMRKTRNLRRRQDKL